MKTIEELELENASLKEQIRGLVGCLETALQHAKGEGWRSPDVQSLLQTEMDKHKPPSANYRNGFESGFITAQQKGASWAMDYHASKTRFGDCATTPAPVREYWKAYYQGILSFTLSTIPKQPYTFSINFSINPEKQ